MRAINGTYAPTVITGRMRHDTSGQEHKPCGYYRLFVVDEGRLKVESGGDQFTVTPGDAYVVLPGSDYVCHGHRLARTQMVAFTVGGRELLRVERRALFFDRDSQPEALPRDVWGAPWPTLFPRDLAEAIRDSIVFASNTWWRSDQHHFDANHRLAYILARIHTYFRDRPTTGIRNQHPISRVLEVIHEHYRILYTASDIAKHIGISVSRMNESFREASGETPMACLRRYRLSEVERLLLTTRSNVNRIAEMTGYKNGKSLYKAWMKEHTMPPLQWRHQHQI